MRVFLDTFICYLILNIGLFSQIGNAQMGPVFRPIPFPAPIPRPLPRPIPNPNPRPIPIRLPILKVDKISLNTCIMMPPGVCPDTPVTNWTASGTSVGGTESGDLGVFVSAASYLPGKNNDSVALDGFAIKVGTTAEHAAFSGRLMFWRAASQLTRGWERLVLKNNYGIDVQGEAFIINKAFGVPHLDSVGIFTAFPNLAQTSLINLIPSLLASGARGNDNLMLILEDSRYDIADIKHFKQILNIPAVGSLFRSEGMDGINSTRFNNRRIGLPSPNDYAIFNKPHSNSSGKTCIPQVVNKSDVIKTGRGALSFSYQLNYELFSSCSDSSFSISGFWRVANITVQSNVQTSAVVRVYRKNMTSDSNNQLLLTQESTYELPKNTSVSIDTSTFTKVSGLDWQQSGELAHSLIITIEYQGNEYIIQALNEGWYPEYPIARVGVFPF